MGGEGSLRNVLVLVTDELQLSVTLRHNLLESFSEVLVEINEILLKSLLLLTIKLCKQ